MSINKGLFSSDDECWETPQSLFDELDREFHFTLDAAATPDNAKCARFYTPQDDALKQSWQTGGGSILQSSIRQKDFGFREESIHGISKRRQSNRSSYTIKNRYALFP